MLKATTTVTPVLLDPKGLTAELTEINAAQTDHQAMAAQSRLFIHLGLLPAGSSLEQMELDLNSSQVIGFYDEVSKGLYVLSDTGGVGALEEATFSHEYTHALQDQNFGLAKLALDTADQGDRDIARLSLVEGDAMLEMSTWEQQHLSFADLVLIARDALYGTQADQLAAAPAILSEPLLFPYVQGLAFVQAAYKEGGWAEVNRLYANPPDSTSQILHPALYASHVEPVVVTLPAAPAALGSGWKLTTQDTLGELQLRIWLHGDNPTTEAEDAAEAATAAWGGDRVGLYEGPDGAWAVVMKTAWRSTAGAQAFRAVADKVLAGLSNSNPTRICAGADNVLLVIASNQTVIPTFLPCSN